MATQMELLANMLDEADAIVYLKDEDGRFLFLNRRAAEVLKTTKEDAVGKRDLDFLGEEDAERVRAMDRKVMETGEPVNYEVEAPFPVGRTRILDHKFPVSLDGRRAVGGVAIEVEKRG